MNRRWFHSHALAYAYSTPYNMVTHTHTHTHTHSHRPETQLLLDCRPLLKKPTAHAQVVWRYDRAKLDVQ